MSHVVGTSLRLKHGRHLLHPQPWSFALPKGLCAVVGKNGAGKSTLLQALVGEPLWEGDGLTLEGSPLSQWNHTGAIAFVAQDQVYPSGMTIEGLLRLAFLPQLGTWGRLTGAMNEKMSAVLEALQLPKPRNAPLGELSTGERQKVFVARALLQNPRLLLLDEPTNHLDPGARRAFWNYLKSLPSTPATTTLVSTHDMEFVSQHCAWVLALENGTKVFEGTPREFVESKMESRLFD